MEVREVCGDRCIVRPIRTPLKYGKLHLPTSSVRNTAVGKVLYIGPEVRSAALKPGVIVTVNNLAGVMIDKEKNYLLLKEEDIIAIVEDFQEGERE